MVCHGRDLGGAGQRVLDTRSMRRHILPHARALRHGAGRAVVLCLMASLVTQSAHDLLETIGIHLLVAVLPSVGTDISDAAFYTWAPR